jgi:hypothetical protein
MAMLQLFSPNHRSNTDIPSDKVKNLPGTSINSNPSFHIRLEVCICLTVEPEIVPIWEIAHQVDQRLAALPQAAPNPANGTSLISANPPSYQAAMSGVLQDLWPDTLGFPRNDRVQDYTAYMQPYFKAPRP